MSEKIIQIIPAPKSLFYAFKGCISRPVVCLALVELENGEREVRPMGLLQGNYIDDVGPEAILLDGT